MTTEFRRAAQNRALCPGRRAANIATGDPTHQAARHLGRRAEALSDSRLDDVKEVSVRG
jgi:hypothetical protein